MRRGKQQSGPVLSGNGAAAAPCKPATTDTDLPPSLDFHATKTIHARLPADRLKSRG